MYMTSIDFSSLNVIIMSYFHRAHPQRITGIDLSLKYIIHPDHQDLEAELLKVQDYFDASKESIHKARNELRIASIGGQKMVIKSFKVPHLLNRYVYANYRDSKAKKSYDNAIRLEALAINTPSPIAYLEFYDDGLLTQSYYITLLEPNDLTIREALHHDVTDHREILKAFTAFTYDLHKKEVWHVDYTPGNTLISKEEDDYRFSLVDINRMEFRPISPEEGTKAFSKLWAQDEDLRSMSIEYAALSGLDTKRSYELMAKHMAAVIQNKQIKNWFKGKK